MIVIYTNYGEICIELDTVKTPITAKNFLSYVECGFYENTIFHRVIDNFMIQGGGFTADMQQKQVPFPPINNEAEQAKPNNRGTIAMARTNDPHSASSQFFINVVNNPFLNFSNKTLQGWGYCVFGEVVQGLDVVDNIKSVATGNSHGHQDVPKEPVIIERMSVVDVSPVEKA